MKGEVRLPEAHEAAGLYGTWPAAIACMLKVFL